jgi:hypothetical protein
MCIMAKSSGICKALLGYLKANGQSEKRNCMNRIENPNLRDSLGSGRKTKAMNNYSPSESDLPLPEVISLPKL